MNRLGFTLLETMLAIALTGSVGIAALSLNTMQARLGTVARAQEVDLALVTETVRLLDDDLLLAASHPTYGRFQVLPGGALRLMTSNRLPGETAGLHEVVWRFDVASGAVLRTSTPLGGGMATTRPVGGSWRLFAIALDRDLLWLDAQLNSDKHWRLPLWKEASG
jgi:hypothetical protein